MELRTLVFVPFFLLTKKIEENKFLFKTREYFGQVSFQKNIGLNLFTTQKADFCFVCIVMYNSIIEKGKIFEDVLTLKMLFLCSKLMMKCIFFKLQKLTAWLFNIFIN